MPKRIDTPEYWIGEFQPTPKDLDALYEYALDASRPLGIEELASELVRGHVERLTAAHRVKESGVAVYLPSHRYEKNQRVQLPALGGASGALRQNSVESGTAVQVSRYWLVAVLVAWLRFGAGLELLWVSQLRGVLLTLFVIYIIWAAMALYRVVDEAGATHTFSEDSMTIRWRTWRHPDPQV